MKENIKHLTGIILLLIVILFPILISFITWNFWYIFLYIVWWAPATFLAGLVIVLIDEIW